MRFDGYVAVEQETSQDACAGGGSARNAAAHPDKTLLKELAAFAEEAASTNCDEDSTEDEAGSTEVVGELTAKLHALQQACEEAKHRADGLETQNRGLEERLATASATGPLPEDPKLLLGPGSQVHREVHCLPPGAAEGEAGDEGPQEGEASQGMWKAYEAIRARHQRGG